MAVLSPFEALAAGVSPDVAAALAAPGPGPGTISGLLVGLASTVGRTGCADWVERWASTVATVWEMEVGDGAVVAGSVEEGVGLVVGGAVVDVGGLVELVEQRGGTHWAAAMRLPVTRKTATMRRIVTHPAATARLPPACAVAIIGWRA
ncbi:MAG: hypothetical protein ACR2LQ_12300 [Acidimicrobiales bacterium]